MYILFCCCLIESTKQCETRLNSIVENVTHFASSTSNLSAGIKEKEMGCDEDVFPVRCSTSTTLSGANENVGRSSSNLSGGIDEAKTAQDVALLAHGLFRFCIAEDGNCLFRSIGAQLPMGQDCHNKLRILSANWVEANRSTLQGEYLLELSDMEALSEISATYKEGSWPG